MGAVGEKMLDPWPGLADSVEDHLRAGDVREVGWPEIEHQQPPISVDRNVALAPNRLLGRIIALLGARRIYLDGLAVDNTGARAGFAPGPLTVVHQGDDVERAKQAALQSDGTTSRCLPRRKVLWEHPPAARARHLADRVENLVQVNALPMPRSAGFGSNCNPPHSSPHGEIGRITLHLPASGLASLLSTKPDPAPRPSVCL